MEYADEQDGGGSKLAVVVSDKTPVDILHKLFRAASDDVFEDGMDSYFSTNLHHIIKEYGAAAIDALESVMDGANVGVTEEALRQVGNIDDDATHRARLSLLERALKSSNTRVRDAASIGIEAMNDPTGIEGLQNAIDNEPYEQLRQNFKDVLVQLQDAR